MAARSLSAIRSFTDSPPAAVEAGRTLGVDAVLEGSVQRDGSTIRVRAHLVRVADGDVIWSAAFDEPAANLLVLQDAIASQVAAALLPRLAQSNRQKLHAGGTRSGEAHEAYLTGRYFWAGET